MFLERAIDNSTASSTITIHTAEAHFLISLFIHTKMHLGKLFAAATIVALAAASTPKCAAFPPSMIEYSSGFKQPKPPLVQPEFTANFVQHKWLVPRLFGFSHS